MRFDLRTMLLRDYGKLEGIPCKFRGGAIVRRVITPVPDLHHLVSRLNEEQSWSDVLSGGEQQQLGFARVLLRPPDIIIMDEPTSALDDLSQTRLMELLSEGAPGSIIIHAARRNLDKRFYDREIQLKARSESRAQGVADFRRALSSNALPSLRESPSR